MLRAFSPYCCRQQQKGFCVLFLFFVSSKRYIQLAEFFTWASGMNSPFNQRWFSRQLRLGINQNYRCNDITATSLLPWMSGWKRFKVTSHWSPVLPVTPLVANKLTPKYNRYNCGRTLINPCTYYLHWWSRYKCVIKHYTSHYIIFLLSLSL